MDKLAMSSQVDTFADGRAVVRRQRFQVEKATRRVLEAGGLMGTNTKKHSTTKKRRERAGLSSCHDDCTARLPANKSAASTNRAHYYLGHRTCAKRRKNSSPSSSLPASIRTSKSHILHQLTATASSRESFTERRSQLSFLACSASLIYLLFVAASTTSQAASPSSGLRSSSLGELPNLSSTSAEPRFAIVGQDAFIACGAKNLQNYTIIWRYNNNEPSASREENGPVSSSSGPASVRPALVNGLVPQELSEDELGVILTAGRQRVISDDRFTVMHSHDTWLLKISNVRLSDTGTYICHTNSVPRVVASRILNVVKPAGTANGGQSLDLDNSPETKHFGDIDYNFSECCRAEYVVPRCQRLCSFQQLASRYQSINIVHECYSALPSITRCMVAGRNVTDCCQKRHIPSKCNPMCGHLGDTSAMSVQDQSYCADYSASIMSCVAEGISTLPGQPELVIVEAVSSTTLKVSWQKVTDEQELKKIDGWIINLTKLSSFEDTISARPAASFATSNSSSSSAGAQMPTGKLQPANPTTLANLTIVDVMNNSSLAAMSRLLAASSATVSLKLDKQASEFSIDNLKPYTVYQIQMFAYNSLGRSQLTEPIRALTLAPESELSSPGSSASPSSSSSSELASGDVYVEPNLPDTRKCCLDRGVTLKRCLDTLCDPVEADRATIADLMICAPWSNVTFSCLSSRVNHTDCCKARGVTPFCLSMCAGDIKRVDYRHFRCLTHMSAYTGCILESHNVLPSEPQNFTVGPITHSWAVLNWRAPKKHARSLQGYRIFWRRVNPFSANTSTTNSADDGGLTHPRGSGLLGDPSSNDDFFYSSAEAATNPYLLDALTPETVYETFVVAVNKFGQSESSVRFIFQTLADPQRIIATKQAGNAGASDLESRLPLHGNTTADQSESEQTYYNETTCCLNSGVHAQCQQLCDYDLKVTDVSSLITSCNTQMPVILRCMAGSRNSVPCCRNRGVSDHCLNVCAGLTEHSPLVVATRCATDFGKIIRCMDEGSKQIPSAPVDLHTVDIKSDKITIKWAAAAEDSLRTDIEYHIRYQQLQSTPTPTASGSGGNSSEQSSSSSSDLFSLIAVVPLHPLEHNLILTTNKTEATIDKLKANSRYSIYVTAENPFGISLPSLVLVIQTPDENTSPDQSLDEYKRRATLGAPHSLEILRWDTESIVLKWVAPLFISNDAQIKYRVFYKLLQPSPPSGDNNSSSPADSTSSSGSSAAPAESNAGSGDGATTQLSRNWTVVETSDTSVILKKLRYSSEYVITVQAFSKQLLGHMSEILLANTAKPVPPTLNQPLIINKPIEGNNITIMCVALGEPTPQISMFINGLLVQKRTQPYVIYHLVNLVRGHLTITCFASNGHGKDYASVQSRTEVDVKFPTKATAKARLVRANLQSTARLSCEISGNPQPTVVWTFTPNNNSAGDPQSKTVIGRESSDHFTTVLVSQYENQFTWTHTLMVRNVSQADAGTYQCRSKNMLSESEDSIQLVNFDAKANANSSSSYLNSLEQNSDLMECCRSQNVSAKCLPVCSPDGLDVESAFKIPECQTHLDKLMYCAADGGDHRNCCRTRLVPFTCLRWCSGAKPSIPALCFLSSAIDINQCFQEGRTLLPGPPRNLRVLLASESEHGERDPLGNSPSNSEGSSTTTTTTMMSSMMSANMFPGSTSGAGASGSESSSSSQSGQTTNQPSVISSMAMMMGDHNNINGGISSSSGDQQQAANNNNEQNGGQQQSEPFVIEWDPPAKNPNQVQYYRIFWRPFGSRELSRTVTNLTWIKLNDLNTNKIYEFVVKAANTHGSSVYSDPLTVKPAEILAQSNTIGSAGLTWFMPTSGSASLLSRVLVAICFATVFMFSSLALVVILERKGYLKRFASSKSNSSRISFANPAYLKDSDGNGQGGDNITWDAGHSLDILAPPSTTTSFSAPQGSQANGGGQHS